MAVNQKQAFGQKQGFEKKLVGLVTVVTGDRKAKFTLIEDGKQFKNGTNSLTVLLEDLPDRPQLKPNDKSGKQYRIRMNSEGTEVEALTPVVGVFDADLIDLGPRPEKDSDPMPKERVWNEGKSNENRYQEFFAVYKISAGNFKGVQMPAYNMHYKFEEDTDNPGFARFTFSLQNRQATRGKQLADWGHIHGVWEVQGTEIMGEPIAWDDETILPEILERALEHPKARLVVKDGYIKEVLPSDEEPDFMEEVSDEIADAVDEMLDGDDAVEPVKVKSTSPKPNGKVKPAPARPTKRVVKKMSEEDDDL